MFYTTGDLFNMNTLQLVQSYSFNLNLMYCVFMCNI